MRERETEPWSGLPTGTGGTVGFTLADSSNSTNIGRGCKGVDSHICECTADARDVFERDGVLRRVRAFIRGDQAQRPLCIVSTQLELM